MSFQYSIYLIAIPVIVLLLIYLFWASAKRRKAIIGQFAAQRLLGSLITSFSPARMRLKQVLILCAVTLGIVALARPQWDHQWRETQSKGIDILFALDASRSMLANDIKPNRLIRSKLAIQDFLKQLEGDRVGLIAFAGNAFLQCPLTLDYNAFQQSLNAIDTDIIATGGTDISRALIESESAFKNDNNYKIIVLITDGEDLEHSGIQQAKQAAENGVTIYTVGVGTEKGELIPIETKLGQVKYLRDSNGQIVTTQLDQDTLAKISEVTDGFYVPLGPTGNGLQEVYQAGLKSIPEQELSAKLQRVGIERYQWPLGLAILCLAWEPLIGTRRWLRKHKKD